MEEKRNHSRSRSKIVWNGQTTISCRNPHLELSGSNHSVSGPQRKSSKQRPRSRLPRYSQQTNKCSNQDHERGMRTPPRNEERDELSCERQTQSTPVRGAKSWTDKLFERANETAGEITTGLFLGDRKEAQWQDKVRFLVRCLGTPGCTCSPGFQLYDNNEDLSYQVLRELLSRGSPLVCKIEGFPAFLNTQRKQYCGKISDIQNRCHDGTLYPRLNEENRIYRTFVIVGIEQGEPQNGPMVLVEDTCKDRPLFAISWRLLMSMGIGKLDFTTFSRNRDLEQEDYFGMSKCSGPSRIDGSPRGCMTNWCPIPRPKKEKHHFNILDYCFTVKEGEFVVNII